MFLQPKLSSLDQFVYNYNRKVLNSKENQRKRFINTDFSLLFHYLKYLFQIILFMVYEIPVNFSAAPQKATTPLPASTYKREKKG